MGLCSDMSLEVGTMPVFVPTSHLGTPKISVWSLCQIDPLCSVIAKALVDLEHGAVQAFEGTFRAFVLHDETVGDGDVGVEDDFEPAGMVWSGLARLLGFRVGFDGQNPSLAGSSFLSFSGHLKALSPAKAVVKMKRNIIKFCILSFVSREVTGKN